jgi:hypothetical protein
LYFDIGQRRSPEGTSRIALNKRNRQMGFQVKGDRQKGSRVSLFEGRQMGPRITCLKKKGNRQMGFQVD